MHRGPNASGRILRSDNPSIQLGREGPRWGNGSGCAVYIGGNIRNQRLSPTISNCFIVENAVGIAIEALAMHTVGDGPVQYDGDLVRPTIINNTIARNAVAGIWNGNRHPSDAIAPALASINVGAGRPVILNNIIDGYRTPTVPPGLPPASVPSYVPYSIVGVHWDDMRLKSYLLSTGPPVIPSTLNPNAYQLHTIWAETVTDQTWNRTSSALPSVTPDVWNIPGVQGSVPVPVFAPAPPLTPTHTGVIPARAASVPGAAPYAPRVDITPYTNTPCPTCVLYINDVFRQYIDVGSIPRSQHDFRLAPTVRDDSNNTALNPLIGQGLNESPDGNPNTAGNTVIAHYYFGKAAFIFPSLQDSADFPTASEHFWDWDVDGFGNRRIGTNIKFTPAVNAVGDIDIGADEVGDIVISGYLNYSRIFSQTHPVGGSVVLTRPAIEQFYFGHAGTNYSSRPYFTALLGGVEPWYQHVESFGMTATDTGITGGGVGIGWRHAPGGLMATYQWATCQVPAPSFRGSFIGTTTSHGIPRNLYCDFAPILLPDPKPWGMTFPLPRDEYCASPWYNRSDSGAMARHDNQAAYWHPPGGTAADNPYLKFSQPLIAISSPPGTMENDVSLSGPIPPYPLHASNLTIPPPWMPLWLTWIHHSQPAVTVILFDTWGVGDSGALGGTPLNPLGYDPANEWHGIRVNTEMYHATTTIVTNLQTFLIINGDPTPSSKASANPFEFAPLTAAAMTKDRERVQQMLKSPIIPQKIAERRARMAKAMRPFYK